MKENPGQKRIVALAGRSIGRCSSMTADEAARTRTAQVEGKAEESLERAAGNSRAAAEGQDEKGTGGSREAKEKSHYAFQR